MKAWQKQLGILVLFKIAYLSLVTGMVLLFPAGKNSQLSLVDHIRWTPEGHPTLKSYFTTWDAGHYLYLSEHGYHAGDVTCAFYPLWPLLIRWFSILTCGDHIISGMVLANAFSLAGFFILFKVVSNRYGPSTAWRAVALLLAFPGSLFYQFVYTEGLYFFLLMLLCFALDEKCPTVALAAGFLLPLTRAVGIFSILPIALYVIARSSCRGTNTAKLLNWIRRTANPGDKQEMRVEKLCVISASPTRLSDWWLPMAPLCGWALYLTLMWSWTGNAFEGFGAQRYWGAQSISNLLNVPMFAVALVTPTCWHGYIGSACDRLAFIALIYCLPLVWRLDKIWFVWAIVLGVVPAMSGHFTSFIRFESTVFPLFVALAAWFNSKGRMRSVLWLLTLATSVALHLTLLWRFVYFQWAG